MTPPSPWQPAPAHDPSAPDATTRSWLREQGSLTTRLRRHWPDLAVQVLAEGLGPPLPHEARRLCLADGAPAWLRCVLLVGGGLPRVYARTVIPDGPALATWAEVQALGQQPRLVRGDATNLKVTYPADLTLAALILRGRK